MTKPLTGMNKLCQLCSKEFYVQRYRADAKYCSKNCYNLGQRKPRLKCIICGNDIRVKRSQRANLYCSQVCHGLGQRNGEEKECAVCKKLYYVAKWQKSTSCSKKCHSSGLKKPLVTLLCKHCGISFQRKGHEVRRNSSENYFCSVKCLCLWNNKTGKALSKRINTKPEQETKRLLRSLKVKYISNFKVIYKSSVKFYDIFIPSLNLLIEVDGIYWHAKELKMSQMNDTQQHNRKNDKLKNKIAKNMGYKLVRIWEDEITIQKIKEIVL